MKKILRNLVRRDIVAHTKMLIKSMGTLAESKKVHLILSTEHGEMIFVYNEDLFQLIFREMLVNIIKNANDSHSPARVITLYTNAKTQELTLRIMDQKLFAADGKISEQAISPSENLQNHFDYIVAEHSISYGIDFSLFIPVVNNTNLYLEQSHFSKAYLDQFDKDYSYKSALSSDDPAPNDKTLENLPLILIINSQPELESTFRDFLQRQYRLVIVDGGQEGVASAFTLLPDIIISDVKLHDKSGIQICWLLKKDERTCHIPFVLFSTVDSQVARIASFNVDVDAYLSWPFTQEELILRLRNLIKLRHMLEKKYYGFKNRDDDRIPWQQIEKTHNTFIREAATVIYENLGKSDFGNAEFARKMALSESHLNRKIKAITGNTLSLFIREIRLEEARLLLINSDRNISEIAYEVGFNDPAYFSRTFSLTFGISPSKFRAMFWM